MQLTVHTVGLIVIAIIMLTAHGCVLIYTIHVLILRMRSEWKPLNRRTSAEVPEVERIRIAELEANQKKYLGRLIISIVASVVASWAASAWRQLMP